MARGLRETAYTRAREGATLTQLCRLSLAPSSEDMQALYDSTTPPPPTHTVASSFVLRALPLACSIGAASVQPIDIGDGPPVPLAAVVGAAGDVATAALGWAAPLVVVLEEDDDMSTPAFTRCAWTCATCCWLS